MNNTYLIFSALFAPHIGGVETYTINLARELTALGNHVVIIAQNTDGCEEHEQLPEAEVFRLPCMKAGRSRFPIPRNDRAAQGIWNQLQSLPVDGVIVNTRFYPLSYLGVEFARKRNVVPVIIDHGSAHLTIGNPLFDIVIQQVEHLLTNRIKKFPAHYYGVSSKSVEWLTHFGIEAKGVLNNAIDARAFRNASSKRDFRNENSIGSEAFAVAYTGRLAPEKGVMQLCEAARAFEGENVHFLLAGDGSLEEELRKRAPSNFHLLGPLPPKDISALLQSCDAFCMPTRSEGFSTSLLEAAACGVAPIITDVGGVGELVPTEEFGIVVADREPATIATAIRHLNNNRDRCNLLGNNIKQRVETEFAWKKVALKAIEACQEARA